MTNIFRPCDILLPVDGADMNRWAVVACDQHTSEPEYWERVKQRVGNSPSTLNFIVPEHQYRDTGIETLVSRTRAAMDAALFGTAQSASYGNRVFRVVPDSYIYIERSLMSGKTRRGIVGAVDLDEYDPAEVSFAAVRTTEGVVTERLPPRIKLRDGAPFEQSHIMLLSNEQLSLSVRQREQLEPLYDFELMEDGGHIRGWRLPPDFAAEASNELATLNSNLLLVGDGNHSLATAKACWEKLKPTLTVAEQKTHPCRFALAEVVSIHEPALEFEPIHRVIFDCDPAQLLLNLSRECDGDDTMCYAYGDHVGLLSVPSLTELQAWLDAHCEPEQIDYIHGDDVAVRLAHAPNRLAIILPVIDKSEFFERISAYGALPRKAFSMGHARDKRYYVECRSLVAI
jgi:hypothetical protein